MASVKFAFADQGSAGTSGNSRFQAHVAKLKQDASAKTDASSKGPNLNHKRPPSSGMTHLQHHWPGQTGNGNHLDVRPVSFYDLLSQNKIVIPLFQRRYCWTQAQILQWWKDVSQGVGQHSTHKTMFKRSEDALICVDGQQRLTTTTLLLMALRAQARRQDASANANLISGIDRLLVPGADALAGLKRWSKYQAFQLMRNAIADDEEDEAGSSTHTFQMPELSPGWLTPFETTLTPSYVDRVPYFELLCRDHVLEALEQQLKQNDGGHAIELKSSHACQQSAQFRAFDVFSKHLRQRHGNSSSLLNRLYQKQLHGFSLMYIELLTDDNVQQIFLWMQEKSVFGMGRLLHNPHPGVDFAPIDLARNLVVSSVMDEPLPQQVEFYQQCWVRPLESRFGTEGTSRILDSLVQQVTTQSTYNTRRIGDMEQRLEEFKSAVPPAMQEAFGSDQPMMVYARFHSYVQERAVQLEGSSSTISRRVADSIVREMVALGERMEM